MTIQIDGTSDGPPQAYLSALADLLRLLLEKLEAEGKVKDSDYRYARSYEDALGSTSPVSPALVSAAEALLKKFGFTLPRLRRPSVVP